MAIQIKGLTKSFDGQTVIADLSLDFPEKGIIGLSGPSGCGKTTLLHVLAGLQKPDAGRIDGLDGIRISMVFQEDRLLPWLSAAENIALVLPQAQSPLEWLHRVNLDEWASHYPAEMSGGMKRRIALARALAYESSLLLLDEPFTGMDAGLKLEMFALLREDARNRLIILVTHDQADLLELADRMIIAAGPPLRLENGFIKK